jgi:pyridoxal phosphate enzyme (YggS family)
MTSCLWDAINAPMTIAARLAAVRERITAAALRSGRGTEAVTLVAVSKRKPASDVRAALRAGCCDFGENYVQELADKDAELAEEQSLRWHFIGHLQRNKVKHLLRLPRLVLLHGVDSPRLIAELDKRASKPLDVLLQVDVSGEETKNGCRPSELGALIAAAEAADEIRARGLMCMPPPGEPEEARPFFARLRELRDIHGGAERIPDLSMGMSHDFEVAIEEGATIVRVGSAIFGPREG